MDKKFVGLVSMLFIISVLLLVLTLSGLSGSGTSPIYEAVKSIVRGKEGSVASADKSLMFCWPIQQAADGKSKITVSVFARNSNQKALPNHLVTLSAPPLAINPKTIQTNKDGVANFSLASVATASAQVTAIVDNSITLSSKCSAIFK